MTDEHLNIEISWTAMAQRYPSLDFRLEERNGKPIGVWEGWLQPIRSRVGLNGIVCDLDADRQILIDRDVAAISHSPKCTVDHNQRHPILDQLKRPDRPFRVRIEYTGGAVHPRAWLLNPVVTSATHYHMFVGGRICAYPPQTDVWRAEDHNVADFTDHILVWTFKWNTWVETDYWLGSEENHDPLYLIATIKPQTQCWCGSGKTYGECCRRQDSHLASLEMEMMLRKRSPLLQVANLDRSMVETVISFLNPKQKMRIV